MKRAFDIIDLKNIFIDKNNNKQKYRIIILKTLNIQKFIIMKTEI